tara:strand:+ start:45 stop:1028 length:984 start_codon:yes stop_codon:yes gene_type:complete
VNKVLITGGAGFIGYHLGKHLKQFFKVDLLDNFSRGIKDSHLQDIIDDNTKIIDMDLLNFNKLFTLNSEYTYIFHLAAIVGVKNVILSPYKVLQNNYLLTNNIIEFAKKQKKLKRFVFASTSEVYASTLKNFGIIFPTKEKTPLSCGDPKEIRNTYALSKIYGEASCFHSGLPITIVRPHNFYGPRMGLSHVIPELIKKIYSTEEDNIDIYSANHQRTFLYIDDAIKIISGLAQSDKTLGEIFNIGDQKREISIIDLSKIIIKILKKDIIPNPLEDINDSPTRRCPSMEKTNKLINIQDTVSLELGIKKCYEWFIKNTIESKINNSE